MNKHTLLGGLALAASCFTVQAQEAEKDFTALMDGKTFDGWKVTSENSDTWSIKRGAFVADGPRAHLFYEGDGEPFTNFHLKVEVMTKRNANGGIYFHTKFQDEGWPTEGFECQVNVSHGDWKKTGSLYDVANIGLVEVEDNEWWLQEIIVENNVVTVKLDGKTVLQYHEPKGAEKGGGFTRKLAEGTFALQGHDPDSEIHYKNIRVKRL